MSTPKSSGLTVFQRLVQQLAQHMELKNSFDSDAAYVLQLSIDRRYDGMLHASNVLSQEREQKPGSEAPTTYHYIEHYVPDTIIPPGSYRINI